MLLQVNVEILLLRFLQNFSASHIWYKPTKPLNCLYIVVPLLITLTVLLGSINQIGICDDHTVCSGAKSNNKGWTISTVHDVIADCLTIWVIWQFSKYVPIWMVTVMC